MNSLMHDLSVDDIYNMRIEDSKIMERMTSSEISNYIENEISDFRKLLKGSKDLILT